MSKLPSIVSEYTFERSELWVLQQSCETNEDFLNYVANLLGKRTAERDDAKRQLAIAEDTIRVIEHGF